MKRNAILVTLSILLFLGAAPLPDPKPQPVQSSGWTYEGCFQPPNQSQCYDVYVHNGSYWICKSCGSTGTPTEQKCRPMTSYELAFGLWCS